MSSTAQHIGPLTCANDYFACFYSSAEALHRTDTTETALGCLAKITCELTDVVKGHFEREGTLPIRELRGAALREFVLLRDLVDIGKELPPACLCGERFEERLPDCLRRQLLAVKDCRDELFKRIADKRKTLAQSFAGAMNTSRVNYNLAWLGFNLDTLQMLWANAFYADYEANNRRGHNSLVEKMLRLAERFAVAVGDDVRKFA